YGVYYFFPGWIDHRHHAKEMKIPFEIRCRFRRQAVKNFITKTKYPQAIGRPLPVGIEPTLNLVLVLFRQLAYHGRRRSLYEKNPFVIIGMKGSHPHSHRVERYLRFEWIFFSR